MDTNLYAKPRVKNTAKMSRRSNWQSRLLTCTLICLISSLTQGLSGIQAATFTRQTELESSTYLYEGKTKYNDNIRYPPSFKLYNLKKDFIIIEYFHYNYTNKELPESQNSQSKYEYEGNNISQFIRMIVLIYLKAKKCY